MSEDFKLILYMLLGAFALGAVILWITDYLYTRATGKPASERIREQKERAKAPLTKSQYRFRFFLYCTILTFCLAASLFSQDFRGWRRSRPIAYAVAFSWSLIDLIRKRKRQGFADG